MGLLLAAAAFGQTGSPNVANAHLETRAFSGNLSSQLNSSAPAWFGYAIKTKRGDHDSCCWSNNGSGCWLEENRSGNVISARPGQPIQLEGTDTIALLLRVENNQVKKVRTFSLNCPLDAGGLPFTWITGVPAAQSVEFLRKLIHEDASNNISNSAILALSRHDDPLGMDALIQLAKSDASPHIREQALFWLAQKAGARASATITDAILNDPDTNVKKRAVFALSQLPKDESVPKLIEIARTQRNPEVRKQAFFWLGQSKDPRALAFIEEVLTK
jgi:HEAT repeat protein